MSPQEWRDLLSFDNVNDLSYFSMCVNETLRVDSPPISFGIQLTEPIDVCGVSISNDHPVIINLLGLHMNEEEWFFPDQWMP